MEAGRRTLPGGPKVPVWHVRPQQGQRWAAPTRLFRPPNVRSIHLLTSTASSLPSLANTVVGVGTAGGGPRRWWLAAGVWGRVALLGSLPRLFRPSVGAGCGCPAGLAWSVGDGRVLRAQKGCRQPSISSRCQRPAASTCCCLGWEGFFFFFSCLSFVLFSHFASVSFLLRWESAGCFLLLLIFHQKMQARAVTPGDSASDEGGMGGDLGYPRYQDCPARGSLRPNPTKGLFAGDVPGGEQAVQAAGWLGRRQGTPDP